MKNISNQLCQVQQSWISPSLWSIMNLKTFSDQKWLAHCQRSEMATNKASVLLLSLNTCSSAPVQPEIMRTLTSLWLFSCAFPALLLWGQQTFALIGPWYLTAFCFIHEEWDSSSNKCMIRNRGFTQDHNTELRHQCNITLTTIDTSHICTEESISCWYKRPLPLFKWKSLEMWLGCSHIWVIPAPLCRRRRVTGVWGEILWGWNFFFFSTRNIVVFQDSLLLLQEGWLRFWHQQRQMGWVYRDRVIQRCILCMAKSSSDFVFLILSITWKCEWYQLKTIIIWLKFSYIFE